jgi:hypothetical protein
MKKMGVRGWRKIGIETPGNWSWSRPRSSMEKRSERMWAGIRGGRISIPGMNSIFFSHHPVGTGAQSAFWEPVAVRRDWSSHNETLNTRSSTVGVKRDRPIMRLPRKFLWYVAELSTGKNCNIVLKIFTVFHVRLYPDCLYLYLLRLLSTESVLPF